MSYPDSITADFSARQVADSVTPLLAQRWSPRAFKKTAIADQDINTLFEAARVAPSCFNAQPWRFYVSTDSSFDQYLSLLLEGNQIWAKNASLLCFVVTQKTFEHNGKANPYADFDAGAAWMSLALQARQMGLYTHAMGGIKHQEIAEYLQLSDDYKVICGIAIGVADTADTLPEDIAAKEKPSARLPLEVILQRK
jgi:nitroreductase